MFSGHTIKVIGVPFGLGGLRRGANLGPDALRLAGIVSQLRPLASKVIDAGDVSASWESADIERGEGIGFFDHVLGNLESVRTALHGTFEPNTIPIVLGGDHSIELATIPAAHDKFGDELGVLWIDAHADFNTPDTSPSGNLHGMVLGGVCGFDSPGSIRTVQDQWTRLLHAISPSKKYLSANKLCWLGLRDVDSGEGQRIHDTNHRQAISMHEIDRFGIAKMFEHAVKTITDAGVKKLWVSFDADVLDPMIAPGTGTHVRGGLTYREAHLLGEMLHETLTKPSAPFELVGIKIAEVNPILDQQNSTATLCVEWAASLLGKRILPPWK